MKTGFQLRLLFLILFIGVLAGVIAWSSVRTRREVAQFEYQFNNVQLRSFQVADDMQKAVVQLRNKLLHCVFRERPSDLDDFQSESRALGAWIDVQKEYFRAPHERELLLQIDHAYDRYLTSAQGVIASMRPARPSGLDYSAMQANVEDSIAILDLGYQLADTHRQTVQRFVDRAQHSVGSLQQLIFVALFVLLGLGGWLSVVVYSGLVAPLRMKLVESHELLERQEKLASLGLLAAGVAHEIRNPLTAIKACLFMQRKRLDPGSAAYADSGLINDEISRLEQIVKDFLQLAKPSSPTLVEVTAGALLEEVVALLGPSLAKSHIELRLEPERTTAKLRGDPAQLKQVLINLVRNGAESIGQNGKVTLRVVCEFVRLREHEVDSVIIEVADTGSGITPEVQKRLFDPFFTTKDNGTGLGLSLAARIVEAHGGALRYQTRLNQGTTFGIVLPRVA